MVGESDDEDFVGKNSVDEIVGEAIHAELADTVSKVGTDVRIVLQA